jgi:hypothetical protein
MLGSGAIVSEMASEPRRFADALRAQRGKMRASGLVTGVMAAVAAVSSGGKLSGHKGYFGFE